MKIFISIFLLVNIALAGSYRVGEFWSKKHIAKASNKAQTLKESVGEVGASATLFYIGEFNNKHWAITNNHVCPNQSKSPLKPKNKCIGQWVKFFYFKNSKGKPLSATIKDVPLVIKNLDLSLLELSVDDIESFNRFPSPLKLSDNAPYLNQELISIGYGAHNNEYGVLMIEEDSFECQVFSREIKLTKDPDTLNPVEYKVKSFLHGCDVSHGDSGSPILDRKSYEVVGLLWTGKYPKDKSISQEGFEHLPLNFLWSQLNYASPAYEIKKEIDSFFNR